MTTVHVRHIRQANLCARGARAWFSQHNIDYSDFLRNGIDADKILALGDHFGNAVVAKAKEEEQRDQLEEVSDGQG